MTPLEMVREFHAKFKVHTNPEADIFVSKLVVLRLELISEEYEELFAAVLNHDIIDVADALADLVYVIYGTAIAFRIDLDAVLEEVHRSNMTKYLPEGSDPSIPHKISKGADYSPPNLAPILGIEPSELVEEQS